ncbi:hypothetical protein EWM64_g10262 [Hericium alpestre]|uniref:HAT C-terminal dimerisation domain-containing protein n=1 Tax=Hericium alpestre TaxID=135208 RepID=A0A4Y9ZHT8_9AGAM|nr:hypothetical protein EWM64_g10262 [Hericium alpestre]
MIGKVTIHPVMKATVSKNSRIVSFFRSSHYWGGQLKARAKALGINRGLKTNTESRFYALILQAQSVKEYRSVLTEICCRDDARRAINGLTPINRTVLDIVSDHDHWALNEQLIRFCKPLVDVIGNTESRDATLADCMLELIGAHRAIMALRAEPDDNLEFASHARTALLRQFHVMNTDLHWFALLLHPLCRKLAISSALHSRKIETAYQIAIDLASKWNWTEAAAKQLIYDIKAYYDGEPPFAGGIANAKAWWSSPIISATLHPLKAMALKIFSIVPHAGDIERLFSNLAGVQNVKQSTLTIEHMEMLGMLRAHYIRILQERAAAAGKPVRRIHGHMHTHEDGGINSELARELNTEFTWTTPTAGSELDGASDRIPQPEDITEADIEREFSNLEVLAATVREESGDKLLPSVSIESVYSLPELDSIRSGQVPISLSQEANVHTDGAPSTWDPKKLLLELGI